MLWTLAPSRCSLLDEADELLSRGFKDQIYDIFRFLPSDTQVGLFSATMPNEVLEITENSKFMCDPIRISMKASELSLEGTKQFYVAVEKEEFKLDTLYDLYDTMKITQAVIFCNTRRKVDTLTQAMHARDFTVSAIVSFLSPCQPCLTDVISLSLSSTETWSPRSLS